MSRYKDQLVLFLSKLVRDNNITSTVNNPKHRHISLLYHTVSDSPLSHIDQLYSIKTTKEFVSDLDEVLKHFMPVDLNEFIARKKGNTSSKPSFHLSFDDGLSEFHDVVAPILLRKGIPATCFLNNEFIDNKDLFYRYKVSILINEILEQNKYAVFSVWQEKHQLEKIAVKDLLVKLQHSDKALIDELANLCGVSFDEYLTKNQPYMNTLQVESLIAKGFTFGAHSLNHPKYAQISQEEQYRQTIESIKGISEKFKLNYNVFAFPFTDSGVTNSLFEDLHAEHPNLTCFGSAGVKDDEASNNIQRIPVEKYKLNALEVIKGEYFYYNILKIIKRNSISR